MTLQVQSPRKPLQKLYERMERFAQQDVGALELRLAKLDGEWSSGLVVKATTGAVILLGLSLAIWVNVWWLIAVAFSAIILLQDQFGRESWFRELLTFFGFRSRNQIEADRTALKVVRGDFLEEYHW